MKRIACAMSIDNRIGRTPKGALANAPKILLTATPLQNSLMELYGLVSLIDDYAFGEPTLRTSEVDNTESRGAMMTPVAAWEATEMELRQGAISLSATDLVGHHDCHHLTNLERSAAALV